MKSAIKTLNREEIRTGLLFMLMMWLFAGWAPAIILMVAIPHVGLWVFVAYAVTVLAVVVWYQS